jgi:hypothetical protein
VVGLPFQIHSIDSTIDLDRYIKPSLFERYSPFAWLRWFVGKPYPNGMQYKPEGYKIFEVGPDKLEHHGLDECKATRDQLMGSDRGRCPFAFS